MNFKLLCDFFESVKAAKSAEKFNLAKKYIKTFKEEAKKFTKYSKVEENFFLILRLIVPKLDHDRQAYRIKESKIARIIIKMLSLPNGNDKNILSKTCLSSNGDFGDVVFAILRKYITNYKSELTIEELDKYLDDIANRKTDNGLDDILLKLFRKSSPKDTKWIIQILLKEPNIGIGSNKLLNSFHEDAASYYATNNNLKKLCETLWISQTKLHELEISVFDSFRPMLSKRCDATNFKKCFPNNKLFIIENKFDGERFQLHMENNRFKYFSRNGFDFTDNYGATYDKGLFTPKLKGVFQDGAVQKLILDGEMMLWNKETQKFGSKGMTLDVKKLSGGKYQPCYCVFDILLYNNTVLTNEPLINRLTLLKNILKNPVEGTILVSEYREAHCQEDIIDALNLSVDKEEEGLVIKNPESVYKCSDRNSGWFKLKMEYFNDVLHDLDLAMMGGCYGTPTRLNSFFVGICSGKDKNGQQTYLSFSRISSGLSDLQLDEINEKFKQHGKQKAPENMLFGSEQPDIYIEPSNTYVLTVRASELIRSTDNRMKTSYTLRFPRVLSVREDKPVDECLSMNELLQLSQQNKAVIKLNKCYLDINEITANNPQKKKAKIEIPELNHFNSIGNFLEGIKFFVVSGNEECPKDRVYSMIKQCGGMIAYKEEANIDIILVGKIDHKIDQLISKFNNKFDIILISWLQRILQMQTLVNYNPNEIVCYGQNFKLNLFGDNSDIYGDSFADVTTIDSLKTSFNLVKRSCDYLNMNGVISLKNDFGSFVAYFDKFERVNDPNSKVIYSSLIDEIEFKYRGGIVSEQITPEINLIVIGREDEDRKETVKQFLNDLHREHNDWRVEIKSKSFLYFNN